jgi:hypothetical protein
MSDSDYTAELKTGIRRVNELTNDYRTFVTQGDNGMAAMTKGQLEAARAYLEGMVAAHDLLTKGRT